MKPEAPLTPLMNRLARDLYRIRTERNLTVDEVAKSSGLSRGTILKLEHGQGHCRGITLVRLAAWAAELGVTEFAGFSVKKEAQ